MPRSCRQCAYAATANSQCSALEHPSRTPPAKHPRCNAAPPPVALQCPQPQPLLHKAEVAQAHAPQPRIQGRQAGGVEPPRSHSLSRDAPLVLGPRHVKHLVVHVQQACQSGDGDLKAQQAQQTLGSSIDAWTNQTLDWSVCVSCRGMGGMVPRARTPRRKRSCTWAEAPPHSR